MVVNSVIADNRFSLRLLANLIAYCKYLHFAGYANEVKTREWEEKKEKHKIVIRYLMP